MDLDKILKELYAERELINEAVRTLESMAESGESVDGTPRRRGRKNMPEEERQAVSRRMKKYWAARRNK